MELVYNAAQGAGLSLGRAQLPTGARIAVVEYDNMRLYGDDGVARGPTT